MGGIVCHCSRNGSKSKQNDMGDKDESLEPMLKVQESNKETATLKIGQSNNNNTITWKYRSFDNTQQNDISNKQSKHLKHGSKEIASFEQSLKQNDNNNIENKSKINNNNNNGNEEDENSDISDLSENNEIEHSSNDENIEALPKSLPILTEIILISNAGFQPVNGEYRWFLQPKKWCLFREGNSYCIENNVNVQNVYTQLSSLRSKNANFRWNEAINNCWIIADFEGNTIYYASPQLNNDTIPNCQWISIHGSKPLPTLSNNHRNCNHDHKNINSKTHRLNSNLPTIIDEDVNKKNEEVGENEESPVSDIE